MKCRLFASLVMVILVLSLLAPVALAAKPQPVGPVLLPGNKIAKFAQFVEPLPE